MAAPNVPIRLRIVFSKTGPMRFISHLDLMRLFQRACRRAALPVTVTQGFSPHLKISVVRALKLGEESRSEEAVISMRERIAPDEWMQRINSTLPEGVRVTRVEES